VLRGGERRNVTDSGYTTDRDEQPPEPGDFENDQDPEDRAPTPGNAPAPGQRPSDSGSTPSDLETTGDDDGADDVASV